MSGQRGKSFCGRVALRMVGFAAAVAVMTSQGLGQFPEDALRLATPGIGVGARSLGMGNAFTGVASDYSALYWNPAGLAQMQNGEFSLGLSHLNYEDQGTFFDSQQSYSINATHLNALGVVLPVPVRKGNLVFALGYNRQSEFSTGLLFEGFNPVSSIVQTYAENGRSAPADPAGNIAWELYLADTASGLWNSPILNRVTQLGKVLEEGGINNWSAGGAIDIAKDLSVGVTVTYLSGSYKYDRNYQEQDNRHIYARPYDFKELTIDDYVESEITGVNAKIGLLYKVPERFRLGLTVKTPTSYDISEDFNTTAKTVFYTADDQGNFEYGPLDNPGSGKYDVNTPWVLGAGASVILRDLMLSGDVEYTDWTQLEFKNATPEVLALNRDIKDIFRATLNLRGGLEYDLKDYGLRLRGGFIFNPSPYNGDPSSFDQKYVTAGLGILLGETSMLDLAFARGWWQTFRVNYGSTASDPGYGSTSRVDEKITTNNFMLTFSTRF